MQASPEAPGSGPEIALEVEEISVRFGGLQALQDVSLEVPAGTVCGLVGPNGAGKTTLFDVITGLLEPDRGRVRVGGVDVTSLPAHRRAKMGLSRTFQRLELFWSLSAGDNVKVGVEASWARRRGGSAHPDDAAHPESTARMLMDRVGLGDLAEAAVDCLTTGSARLVELARALAVQPRIILLDEPGSGLDSAERAVLADLLRDLAASGTAVLLVEHDVDLVMRTCEHVTVLDFGKVIASGTPHEVRSSPAVQAAYLGSSEASR
ncbi:MAG: ABC transporter ATP-binding protein [Acidimicrobiales bacterium]